MSKNAVRSNDATKLSEWVTPTELDSANFNVRPKSQDAPKDNFNDIPPPTPEKNSGNDTSNNQNDSSSNDNKNDSAFGFDFTSDKWTSDGPSSGSFNFESKSGSDNSSSGSSGGGFGGLDPSMLLGLLGGQNESLAPLMGLLKGEKPDMMAMLPLLMQLMQKKDTTKKTEAPQKDAPVNKTINIDDYTVI